MTVIAVTMVKDERDIIAPVINRMAQQVDEILVADNRSTDGTRDLLEELPCRWVDDPEVAYYQSGKMTHLAQRAREEMGATWVLPFDADEVWVPESGTVRSRLMGVPKEAQVVEAMLYEHVATAQDSDDPDPVLRMRWRRAEAKPLRKVACRPAEDLTILQGNHFANYSSGYPLSVTRGLEVRHFPYRTADQFVTKIENGAAAYAAAKDLPEDVGAHWRGYGRVLHREGADTLREAFRTDYFSENPQADGLVEDPVPY